MADLDIDYYELLEVDRGCDDGKLKSAYRKLAMRYHPDKNPGCRESEARFKAINEAYDCLKDPQKRAAYDRFGKAAFQNGGMGNGGGQGFDGFADIFQDIFGRSEEHTSELQSLMRISYAVFCLKKNKKYIY